MLFLCQAGYEPVLERELGAAGLTVAEREPGWVRAEPVVGDAVTRSIAEFCFPHLTLLGVQEFRGSTVNALANQVAGMFAESVRGEWITAEWPFVVRCVPGVKGLASRASAVEAAALDLVARRLPRVSRLARPELPPGLGSVRGLFVFFAEFGRVFVAREAWRGGQRRMADDPAAPSRSYLKVEEAYGILGREPSEGETVCDLGAAPGGWSYSAARRGARVVAVDNGPLKGGAFAHPLIEHVKADAFRFEPGAGRSFDWLFCDLVEEPHHVLHDLVEPWVARDWCRRFVVMLKFGRADPIALLREVRAAGSPLAERTTLLRVRHLYHDREEFTIVGEVGA